MKEGEQPQSEPGREEEEKAVIEDLRFLLFRVALAHRLQQRIMTEGLLTSTYDWYADLERVRLILSEVDSTLRRVLNGPRHRKEP